MNVAHVNIKGGQNTHCFFDGVWNIVKFKIKENLVSAPFKLANDIRAFGIKEFHTDFNKRLSVRKCGKEIQHFRFFCKIAGDDYVFTHYVLLR